MKPGIARRLALILALLGILVSGLTGYYAYAASRDLLVQAAEQRLLTATHVLVRQLQVAFDTVSRDVLLAAGHPEALAALTAPPGQARRQAEDDLSLLFERILATRPEYFQIRLIGATENGLERVRLDRDSTGLVRVTGNELQEKSHFPYVFEGLRLPPDKVYISTPVINHERGAHAGLDKPSLQIAAAVVGHTNSRTIGLIVINVDLDTLFGQLSADLPPDIDLLLTNRLGDFLVHPDPGMAFAFDRGQRALVHEVFPATTALINGEARQLVTTARMNPDTDAPVVAAFVKQSLPAPQEQRFFVLGLAQPLASVVAESDAVGTATIRIVLGLSALAVVVAVFLARAITRPLSQVVRAVRRFTSEHTREPLPIDRNDEIGILARSVDDMQSQIDTQLQALFAKQSELDHLASHDPLTGLPNRRVFMERLEWALAHARRDEQGLAVLFIDLDHFKEINDRLGHAAGDHVLLIAARRMHSILRETDTIARLGGDEFLVLLEGARDPVVIAEIADKLIGTLAQPIPYDDDTLCVEASIGISRFPHNGQSPAQIIAAADNAMYRSKAAGRNRHTIAEPDGRTDTTPAG